MHLSKTVSVTFCALNQQTTMLIDDTVKIHKWDIYSTHTA